jgi:hypothetical protein
VIDAVQAFKVLFLNSVHMIVSQSNFPKSPALCHHDNHNALGTSASDVVITVG